MKLYLVVIKNSIHISFKKIKAYNMEFLMMLFHFIFSFLFVFLFWTSILNNFFFSENWTIGELYIYATMILLADGVGEVFFAFRRFPHAITTGGLDQYLTKPIPTVFLFIIANLNIISILEQVFVSISAFIIISISYEIHISVIAFIISLLLIFIGTIVYQFLYGAFSLISFWFGNVELLREAIFNINEFKKYPLDIFNTWIQRVFTFILPISLISYYPVSIMLNKNEISIILIIIYVSMLLISVSLFNLVWKCGVKRYEANQ